MSLKQIAKWNYDRNGLQLDVELERDMLEEEATEFRDGLKHYLFESDVNILPALKGDYVLDAVVEMVDAYCDYTFVYYGTQVKLLGSGKIVDVGSTQSIMHTLLTEILVTHNVTMFEYGEQPFIDMCMADVIEANMAKPIKKTKGKVTKGKKWIDPKDKIRQRLLDSGFIADETLALVGLKEQLHKRVEGDKERQQVIDVATLEGDDIED